MHLCAVEKHQGQRSTGPTSEPPEPASAAAGQRFDTDQMQRCVTGLSNIGVSSIISARPEVARMIKHGCDGLIRSDRDARHGMAAIARDRQECLLVPAHQHMRSRRRLTRLRACVVTRSRTRRPSSSLYSALFWTFGFQHRRDLGTDNSVQRRLPTVARSSWEPLLLGLPPPPRIEITDAQLLPFQIQSSWHDAASSSIQICPP